MAAITRRSRNSSSPSACESGSDRLEPGPSARDHDSTRESTRLRLQVTATLPQRSLGTERVSAAGGRIWEATGREGAGGDVPAGRAGRAGAAQNAEGAVELLLEASRWCEFLHVIAGPSRLRQTQKRKSQTGFLFLLGPRASRAPSAPSMPDRVCCADSEFVHY